MEYTPGMNLMRSPRPVSADHPPTTGSKTLMSDVKSASYKKDKWFLQMDHAHEKYLTL